MYALINPLLSYHVRHTWPTKTETTAKSVCKYKYKGQYKYVDLKITKLFPSFCSTNRNTKGLICGSPNLCQKSESVRSAVLEFMKDFWFLLD